MTHCWSEGELRAYLDGELPARDMDRLAAHLIECPACHALHGEVNARVARLNRWMEALPDVQMPVRIPAPPRPKRTARRWAGIAVGLAASLLIAMVLLPKRAPQVVATPRAATPHALVQPPATVKPAIIRRGIVPRSVPVRPKPKPQIQYYVALDNEPIETGMVVRVGLNGGQGPADVIVGPDGRPRAIRLINEISGESK